VHEYHSPESSALYHGLPAAADIFAHSVVS
jgi:hypothetical protein